jgi:hypothetical protein
MRNVSSARRTNNTAGICREISRAEAGCGGMSQLALADIAAFSSAPFGRLSI